jgi:hypothetical protein
MTALENILIIVEDKGGMMSEKIRMPVPDRERWLQLAGWSEKRREAREERRGGETALVVVEVVMMGGEYPDLS